MRIYIRNMYYTISGHLFKFKKPAQTDIFESEKKKTYGINKFILKLFINIPLSEGAHGGAFG